MLIFTGQFKINPIHFNAISQFPLFICIYHIEQNLKRKLKGRLGSNYDQFKKEFYKAQNSLCIIQFESLWNQLKNDWSEATNYLNRTLEPIKISWAISYLKRTFTANIQSTSRVESFNSIIKSITSHNTSLCQLFSSLMDRVELEVQRSIISYQKQLEPIVEIPNVHTTIFKSIDNQFNAYLLPQMYNKV